MLPNHCLRGFGIVLVMPENCSELYRNFDCHPARVRDWWRNLSAGRAWNGMGTSTAAGEYRDALQQSCDGDKDLMKAMVATEPVAVDIPGRQEVLMVHPSWIALGRDQAEKLKADPPAHWLTMVTRRNVRFSQGKRRAERPLHEPCRCELTVPILKVDGALADVRGTQYIEDEDERA